jgi:hypothetical protein
MKATVDGDVMYVASLLRYKPKQKPRRDLNSDEIVSACRSIRW